MDWMIIAGYIAAVLIGISLGLIGGGGSILTVPVLVYLFDVDPVMATAYSLFIVGLSSLFGAFNFYRKGLSSPKTALIFGIPAILAVYSTRQWIVPAIPQEILSIGNFTLQKPVLLMLIFALLMIFASLSMIRNNGKKSRESAGENQKFNYPMILAEGVLVGVLTGLVGAGGGFLIIPALVIFSRLPMKMAVGTSLLIISAKSLLGFVGDVNNYDIDWNFLLIISGIAVVGIFAGSYLSNYIKGEKLKPAFGWFVLVMGVYILIRETGLL